MGQRSIEIEILEISRDGQRRKEDELAHEEGIIVRLNGETHEFYCIPVDLEEMIVGNHEIKRYRPFSVPDQEARQQ